MTPEIHLHILASGSKGNATLVEGPGGMVLIDCGLSRKRLLERARELGVSIDDVRAVLITHEHADHVSGLSVFARRFEGPLFATAPTVATRSYLMELPFELVGHSDSFELAGMRVQCFPTSHDVADPMCFRFQTSHDAVGYCTDTGVLTSEAQQALAGVRLLALESNHDPQMLKNGPYPTFLKQRVGGRRGHLSNAQAAEALQELVSDDTEVVIGMHLSQENNRPSLAVRALAKAVGALPTSSAFTEARTPDGRLTVCAASQEVPMSVW